MYTDLCARTFAFLFVAMARFQKYGFGQTTVAIQERLCYVGYYLAVERRLAMAKTTLVQSIQFLDGRIIKVGSERFEASEVLFDPARRKWKAKQLFGSVMKGDVNLRAEFFKHIMIVPVVMVVMVRDCNVIVRFQLDSLNRMKVCVISGVCLCTATLFWPTLIRFRETNSRPHTLLNLVCTWFLANLVQIGKKPCTHKVQQDPGSRIEISHSRSCHLLVW